MKLLRLHLQLLPLLLLLLLGKRRIRRINKSLISIIMSLKNDGSVNEQNSPSNKYNIVFQVKENIF